MIAAIARAGSIELDVPVIIIACWLEEFLFLSNYFQIVKHALSSLNSQIFRFKAYII